MKEKASGIIDDKGKLSNIVKQAEEKIKKNPALDSLKDVPMFVEVIKSYIKRDYKEIPAGTIITIVAAVIYWISPLDIISNVIPGIGYVDDALVVAYW